MASRTVDDEREEHRMLVRLNDTSPLLARLVIGQEHGSIRNEEGILTQLVHEKSYTITLHAVLKDYGMTPISRIKPRVRFSRTNYDEAASGSPIAFSPGDRVDFVEFKHAASKQEAQDPENLDEIFCDAEHNPYAQKDPIARLVAQHDVLLRRPPVKTKSKLANFVSDAGGIPIGEFLEALNHPSIAERTFCKYRGGETFAQDLIPALEPFGSSEFVFGIYSRYQRRDCVYAPFMGKPSQPYRTTFDPFTVLGWIDHDTHAALLQPLDHERFTRWEHKINPNGMNPAQVREIAQHIRTSRRDHLIARMLSKSQTALTLPRQFRESSLGLVDETGVHLAYELPLKERKFADIRERRRLRAAFSAHAEFTLHPRNTDIIELHKNLAIGRAGSLEYVLDGASMQTRPIPVHIPFEAGTLQLEQPAARSVVVSADELRSRLPPSLDSCSTTNQDEAGYTILSERSGRGYAVSLGRRQNGSFTEKGVKIGDVKQYVTIRYLGIQPDRFRPVYKEARAPPSLDRLEGIERDILAEMQQIAAFLSRKHVV